MSNFLLRLTVVELAVFLTDYRAFIGIFITGIFYLSVSIGSLAASVCVSSVTFSSFKLSVDY